MSQAQTDPRNTSTETDENPSDNRKTPRSYGKWIVAGVLLILIAALYFTGADKYVWNTVKLNLESWKRDVAENIVLTAAIYFAIYVIVTALSLPTAAILTLVGGALFGRWLGTGIVSIASTLGATIAFLMARYFFRDYVEAKFGNRLQRLNKGVEQDGGFYLFTLRLVPAIPFFVINLGMGLTRMNVLTYAAVSWAGMLIGTFLFVNAGTALASIDTPGEILSTKVLISLALLGIAPLVFRMLVKYNVKAKHIGLAIAGLLVIGVVAVGIRTYVRYSKNDTMDVAIREYSNAEYPEDPSGRSPTFGEYHGRSLQLVKRDATHFDFIFTPNHDHIAKVTYKNVDVSLMTPKTPEWTRDDDGLQRIALTDREWNRQQVRFGNPETSAMVSIEGGDGWEKNHLYSAELAKNCLNAGLWEVLLFEKDGDGKAMYYQGWFTFPLGHYADIIEASNCIKYWKHWYYLEHWFDPVGTVMNLDTLRTIESERDVEVIYDSQESIWYAGEQIRKKRTTMAENIRTWGDYTDGRKIRYGSFIPPGIYKNDHPWKNEYTRMDTFEKGILRTVKSPGSDKPLNELELIFSSSKQPGEVHFLVSGFDIESLPTLPKNEYNKGLYMPMGIGIPPFYQSYDELVKSPPSESPYFSLLLNDRNEWIDHHTFAIDGPVMHRDMDDPSKVHLYFLSYERHAIIAHLVVTTK